MEELMERMNQYLKDRTECFDDLLPASKKGCDMKHVHNWISLSRFYHNYVIVNEDLGRASLQHDDFPEYQRFIKLLEIAILS